MVWGCTTSPLSEKSTRSTCPSRQNATLWRPDWSVRLPNLKHRGSMKPEPEAWCELTYQTAGQADTEGRWWCISGRCTKRESREQVAGARYCPSLAVGSRRQRACWVPRRARALSLRRRWGRPNAVGLLCLNLKPQDQGEKGP